MPNAAVSTAIYELGYKTGDSTKQLNETRGAAESLVKTTDTLTVSVEKETKATRTQADAMDKLLAKLDPRIRAEQNLQRVQEQVQRIQQHGIGTTQQHARAIELAQQKVDKFTAANDNANKAVQGFQSGLNSARNVLAAFGVTLGVAAVVNFGRSVFKSTADLAEQAQQLGINVEAMQAYRGIFLENGIEVSKGDQIIQRLTRTLGEAADGTKKAQDAFGKLGLGARELAGTTADAALPLIAKRLLEIEDVTERARIETELFGKSGQQLESALRALASGSMSDLIARAKDMGIVIDDDLIKKADEAADKMAISFTKLQVAMAPIVTEWVDGFTDMTDSVNGTTTSLEKFLDKIGVLAGMYAGGRIGAAVGGLPGAVVGAATGGMAAYGYTHQEELDRAAIARYEQTLKTATLSGGERKDLEQRLIALQNKYTGFTGVMLRGRNPTVTATELGYAIEPTVSRKSWPDPSTAANAKKVEESARAVAKYTATEIAPATDSIALAAQKQSDEALKQVQYASDMKSAGERYLDSLQEEVRLAGMSREQREIELAVIEAQRVSGGAADRAQIENLVRTRQETERWQGVVTPVEEFPVSVISDPAIAAEIAEALMEITA